MTPVGSRVLRDEGADCRSGVLLPNNARKRVEFQVQVLSISVYPDPKFEGQGSEEGSYLSPMTFVTLNCRLERNKEEEEYKAGRGKEEEPRLK